MSEPAAGGGGRAEMERRLVERSIEDESLGRGCSPTRGRP